MEKITQQELKHLYDTKRTETSIVDVRTLSEFTDCRIKKIPYVPLELLDHIKQPQAVWNKSKPVYVISYSEAHSKVFCNRLETLGYRTFYVEEDGVEAWCKENLMIDRPLVDHQNAYKAVLPNINSTGSNPTFNFEIILREESGFGNYFRTVVCAAWLFEKMNCNIKFIFGKNLDCFENSTLEVSSDSSSKNYVALQFIAQDFERYHIWVSSEYAHNVMSRLIIKKEIQDQADAWARVNLKGDWVGVHLRGTDIQTYKREPLAKAPSIEHLKKIIDKRYNIYLCSDQVQYVDQMNEAFPGRVFYRNIQRSYDTKALHLDADYEGLQQKKDALIDLLILSKADLMYKAAGTFSDLARFFNPEIKIISFNNNHQDRYRKYLSKNYVRVPKAHLLAKQGFWEYYIGRLRTRLNNI